MTTYVHKIRNNLEKACNITATVWLLFGFSEQVAPKTKIVLKLVLSLQNRKHLPYKGFNVCLTKKRKSSPYKVCMNSLKSYKSSNTLLWKTNLLKSFSATATRVFQLQASSTFENFLIKICLWSEVSAQTLSNWITFPFVGTNVQPQ